MPNTCQFQPTRKTIPPCVEEAVTPYGFCKKHSKTQQALKAREKYEEELSKRSNSVVEQPPKSVLKKTLEEPAPRGRPKKEEEPKKRSRRDEEEEPATPRRGKSSKDEESPPRKAHKEEPKRTLAKRNPAPTKKPSKKNSDSESDEDDGGAKTTVRKNKYGNYEDSKTHIVFDPSTKAAYGKQVGSKVEPLTKRDIELCENNGWSHVVPKQSKMANTLSIKGTSRKTASSDEEEDDEDDEDEEEDFDDQEDSHHSDDE